MPGAPRDRVTIDLRGIGNAVRAAAAVRGMGAHSSSAVPW
jgi:hypothetical protein